MLYDLYELIILILIQLFMESLYSVVNFLNNNTVEGVPSNWIKDNTYAWPFNQKNSKQMIEQKYQTNNKEFTFFKIRMLSSGISELYHFYFQLMINVCNYK